MARTTEPAGRSAKTNTSLPSISSKPQQTAYLQIATLLLRQFSGGAETGEIFLTAICSVMSTFPLDVAKQIADPVVGLPGRQNRVPTPFDIRQMGDEIMAERARTKERGPPMPPRLPPPRPERNRPGMWANVFVPSYAPQYQRCRERSRLPDTDPREWMADDRGREGILVALSWLPGARFTSSR